MGVPSKKLSDQLKSDANARIEGLKKQYGVEGLKKLQEKVDNAQQENKVPIPDAVISSFKIPSVDSINWIEVETARVEKGWSNSKAQQNVDSDSADLPFFVQFDGEHAIYLIIRLLTILKAIRLAILSALPCIFSLVNCLVASMYIPRNKDEG